MLSVVVNDVLVNEMVEVVSVEVNVVSSIPASRPIPTSVKATVNVAPLGMPADVNRICVLWRPVLLELFES